MLSSSSKGIDKKSASLGDILSHLGRSFRFKLFIFILLIYITGATLDVTNTNPGSRFMLTKSIAKYGEFSIKPEDRDKYSYLDYSIFNGTIYSDKPPGLSLLAVPIYWIGDFIGTIIGLNTGEDPWIIDDFVKFLIILCVLIFGAFVAIKFYDFLKMLGISHQNANYTVLLFSLGSLFYTYIGTFFSHGITAGFLVLTLYYATKYKQTGKCSSLIFSSFFAGYIVVCDYIYLFFLPFHFIYIFLPFPWKINEIIKEWKRIISNYLIPILIFTIPVVLCGLIILFYNFICFGDPLSTPYSYAVFFKNNQHFANSMFEGLQILLFSTHHGLFTFMPIILLGVLGFIPFYHKKNELALLCISLSIFQILLYSKYFLPTGGLAYGPRHLVTIIPLLIIPLAFLLEYKDFIKKDRPIYSKVIKITAICLGALTFIINFAGGWVGVYPPYEGMLDPIWGTIDANGHLEILFSWLIISFDKIGEFSVNIFNGGEILGFQFNLIFLSVGLGLKDTFASSLVRVEPIVFLASLFLILLFNPYFSLFEIRQKLSIKFQNYQKEINLNIILKIFICLEICLISLFVFWTGFQLFPFIADPIRNTLLNFWDTFFSFYREVSSIPGLNVLTIVVGSLLYILLFLIPFRYNPLSINNWFLNTLLCLMVTSIIWILFEINDQPLDSKKISEKTLLTLEIRDSHLFKRYRTFAEIITIIYMVTSLYSLIFTYPSFSIYSDLGFIIYFSIYFLVLNHLLLPFSASSATVVKENESKNYYKLKSSFDQSDDNLFNKIGFIVSSFILTGLWIKIVSDFLIRGVSLTEIIFITLPENLTDIKDWFLQVEHPVIIILIMTLILGTIVYLAIVFPIILKEREVFNELLVIKMSELMKNDANKKNRIFSIVSYGVGLLSYIFILITVLYSALSTVPDKTVLILHLEEWIIWFFIFWMFLLGIIFEILKTKKEIKDVDFVQN
ncbi:hypothetical protein [Candidatus Hodarchaeum mangrovi]